MTQKIFINGKFLEHPITGTERYALEVSRRILADPAVPAVLLLPKGVAVPDGVDPQRCRTATFGGVALRGMAFEQLTLPVVTRGALLLNFGGPAPLLKRRQLVVMHDATPFRRLGTFSRLFVAWYWLLYAVLTRTAKHLVTVSQFSANELASVFHIPAARFNVAPCAPDHLIAFGEGSRPDSLPAGVTQYALILGTMAKHKNVLPVARAIAATGVQLVIAGGFGKGTVFTSDSDTGGDPDLPANVHLVGRVPDESIVWLYRHALVFVVPSRYEGFGIPLVEAQLEGCPVISSDAASLPEVGAGSVLYFDPAMPGHAADLVRQLAVLDEAQRADVVARSLLNAQRFSWDTTTQQILGIITGTAPTPATAPPATPHQPAGAGDQLIHTGIGAHNIQKAQIIQKG